MFEIFVVISILAVLLPVIRRFFAAKYYIDIDDYRLLTISGFLGKKIYPDGYDQYSVTGGVAKYYYYKKATLSLGQVQDYVNYLIEEEGFIGKEEKGGMFLEKDIDTKKIQLEFYFTGEGFENIIFKKFRLDFQ